MWAQHCVRPIASSGSRAIKKKKIPKKQKTNNKKKQRHFVNQCSRSLLASPLEGAPAAPRGCQPIKPPAVLPHPSQEASGLRLLHGSPKMCVDWRRGSQKHIALEIDISFTSL